MQELPLGPVENFTESYIQNFSSSRQPNALATYIAKIASLKDPEALKCLGNCVTAVLNGNFEEVRNSLDQNPHLKTIDHAYPGLLEVWQTPNLSCLYRYFLLCGPKFPTAA